MRILTLDSALARMSAAVFKGLTPLSLRLRDAERGQSALLAEMAAEVLREAGYSASELGAVAVTVGPGGFTGIRAALALAHGIAVAAAVPVVGVTVGEALAAAAGRQPGEGIWIAIDNRRGGVFLETDAGVAAMTPDGLPLPAQPVVVLGDAAQMVAERLRAEGAEAVAGAARWPAPEGIIRAALDRLAGRLPPSPAQPLYVDPPAVKLPRAGPRPPPFA